jgi:hypothetical protein
MNDSALSDLFWICPEKSGLGHLTVTFPRFSSIGFISNVLYIIIAYSISFVSFIFHSLVPTQDVPLARLCNRETAMSFALTFFLCVSLPHQFNHFQIRHKHLVSCNLCQNSQNNPSSLEHVESQPETDSNLLCNPQICITRIRAIDPLTRDQTIEDSGEEIDQTGAFGKSTVKLLKSFDVEP